MTPALEKAREARAAKLAAGEKLVRLNPAEKAEKNPSSLRQAVSHKCFTCVGGLNADFGYRRAIRECGCAKCPLYAVRPYQDRTEEN